jgi:hypothetical protein
MNKPDDKYVYHGSKEIFDIAVPKRQRRAKITKSGAIKTFYDDISFHATPYRWISIVYTDDQSPYEIFDGRGVHYNRGVDLYKYKEEVEIYGFYSLENSLEKLYGKGGYVFTFEKDKFSHVKGLGNFEMITKDSIKPLRIERVDDPVSELKKLGISFKFINLADGENEKFRNYRELDLVTDK